MYLKIRQKEILNDILNEERVSIKELSKRYSVSERTLYSDVNSIRKWAVENNIRLFDGDTVILKDKEELKRVREILKNDLTPFSTPLNQYSRTNLILAYLLFNDEILSVKQLCASVGISRATLYRDLEVVGSFIEQYKLKVEVRKDIGVYITGSEEKYREAMALYIKNNFENISFFDLLRADGGTAFFSNEKDYVYNLLRNYFKRSNVEPVLNVIEELQQLSYVSLSDRYGIYFVWVLLIAYLRANEGHPVGTKYEAEDIKKCSSSLIETLKKLDIPDEELGYLCFYYKNICENVTDISEDNDDIEHRIDIFLRDVSRLLKVDICHDELLYESLQMHIKTTINRLNSGINDINPIKDDVISSYPELFDICTVEINKLLLFGQTVSEDEISYVVIYIAAALERMHKDKKRVFTVCATGKGNAQLLEINLRKYLPEIDVLGNISIREAKGLTPKEADLVISTTYFENTLIPMIVVSPLMLNSDIQRIKKILDIPEHEFDEDSSRELIPSDIDNDNFFALMHIMTDCAGCVEELEERTGIKLDSSIYFALVIHLIMQIRYGESLGENVDIRKLDKTETLIYQALLRLYSKYEKHIEGYDLESIKAYISREELG